MIFPIGNSPASVLLRLRRGHDVHDALRALELGEARDLHLLHREAVREDARRQGARARGELLLRIPGMRTPWPTLNARM